VFTQKGLSSVAITTIVALLVIGGGIFYFSQIQTTAPSIEKDKVVTEEEKIMPGNKMENNSMIEEKNNAMEYENKNMSKAGSYETYDASKVAMAATNGKAILFFHAGWCPTCRALNSNIESNLSQIPDGVTIFKTNYDSQTALKQKYGVTYQHTLVQVDAEGNQIAKWSGSPTLSDLVSKIQ